MIKITKNTLDKKVHQQISDFILKSHLFPFFYSEGVAKSEDSDFFFNHVFYDEKNKINSSYFESIALPLLGIIKFKKLIRVKLNCYVNQKTQIKNNFHLDLPYNHKVALYNINTNNGYTEFETGEKIVSKANELILFDGKIKHRSVTQNDNNLRLNININYL
jgi:hypothetical protein